MRGGTGTDAPCSEAGIDALWDAGFERAILWVHPANQRARRFYERNGWVADGNERRQDVLGVEVPEVRYELLRRAP